MVVCFSFGHFLTLSVSGSYSTQVVYHANGAFGKNSRYRCNFVYPPHFADEETETQRVKLLLESKNPVMFHSSMQFSFYHIKCRNIAIGNTFPSSIKAENMSENCFTNHSKSHFKESVENFQAQSVIEFFVQKRIGIEHIPSIMSWHRKTNSFWTPHGLDCEFL